MRWKLSCLLICFLFLTQFPRPTTAQNYILEITKFDTYFRVPEVAIPTVSHNVYNTSIGNKEALEWEIVLNQKVLFESISFQFQSENLKFLYQAPLNEIYNKEEWDILNSTYAKNELEEVYRPLNIVGSYAVYHSTKRNNEYKTGKLFHIYRPYLIDAKLQTSWANLSITNNILTITVDQDWLSTATYPVIIDPLFGKTDIGGSSGSISPSYIKTCRYLNDQGDGTANMISLYSGGAVISDHEAGIYDDDGGGDPDNLLDSSDEVSCPAAAQWNNFTISTSISDSTEYHLAWNNEASHTYYWDDGDSNEGNYKASSYGSWLDPFGDPDGGWSRLYSIWCNFTSSEEGQELEFDLFENLLLYASGSATKALGFLRYENINFFASSQMLKEFGFLVGETINLLDSNTMLKEFGFLHGETVNFIGSSQTAKELAFISAAIINFWGYTTESFEGVGLDLTFIPKITVRFWSSTSTLLDQALDLSFIISQTINLVASVATSFDVATVAEYATKSYVLGVIVVLGFIFALGVIVAWRVTRD